MDKVKKGLSIVGKGLKFILVPVLIILLLSSSVWLIAKEDGSSDLDAFDNVPFVVSSKIHGTGENLGEDSETNSSSLIINESGTGYTFPNLKTVEQVTNEIITTVENEGKSDVIDRYIEEDRQVEILSNFIKAEVVSQNIKLGQNDTEDLQGAIELQRNEADGSSYALTYISPTRFDELIAESNVDEIKKYFTLNENEEIIVANWSTTVVTTVSDDEEVWNNWVAEGKTVTENSDGTKQIVETQIVIGKSKLAYKSAVEKYAMPFDLLWALLVLGEDQDFVNELAKLAIDSKIVITAHDNLTTTTDVQTENYKRYTKYTETLEMQKNRIDKKETITKDEETGEEVKTTETTESVIETVSESGEEETSIDCNITTTTVNQSYTTSLNITSVDSWIVSFDTEYTHNNQDGTFQALGETQIIPEETYQEVENQKNAGLSTNEYYSKETSFGITKELAKTMFENYKNKKTTPTLSEMISEAERFLAEESAAEETETEETEEQENKPQVNIQITIETEILSQALAKYKKCGEIEKSVERKIDYSTYTGGAKINYVEKTSKDSATPNFVTLLNESETTKNAILSAPEWLYEILETGDAADMIDMIKYLLYKTTEENVFKNNMVSVQDYFGLSSTNNVTNNFTKKGLSSYLRQFAHSGEAPQSADGKYYLMYGDGVRISNHWKCRFTI